MNINSYSTKMSSTNTIFKSNNEDEEKKADLMQNSLNKLTEMIEFGTVPEYGKFIPIFSEFQNTNEKLNASNVILSIEPSVLLDERPKERELNVKVYSKNKTSSYTVTLFRGEIKDILKQTKDSEMPEKINSFVEEASSKFNEYD